jgi:hypothetical protein
MIILIIMTPFRKTTRSAVNLHEVPQIALIARGTSEVEEQEEDTGSEETVKVAPVVSRAAYSLSLQQAAARIEAAKDIEEKIEEEEEEDIQDDDDDEGQSSVIGNASALHVEEEIEMEDPLESIRDGSGDDNIMDTYFQTDTATYDQEDGGDTGGDADGEEEEDEEEGDEDIEEKDFNNKMPEDTKEAEGDDEYEHTGEEEEDESEEEKEEEEEIVEELDESEEEEKGEEEDEDISDEESEEESPQQDFTSFAQGRSDELVDLVSSSDDEIEKEEAKKVIAPSTQTASSKHEDESERFDRDEVEKLDGLIEGETTRAAVATVLSAYKGRLNAAEYVSLLQIMGKALQPLVGEVSKNGENGLAVASEVQRLSQQVVSN